MGVVKQDADLDFGAVGKLIRALMNPVSADPGSPVNGEMWYNSTSGTFKVRRGGTTDTVAMMSDVTAGGLSSALFDAQSLLIAVADNTPTALSLSASQIVGRRATGDIGAITYAQLKADLEALVLAAGTLGGQNSAYHLARGNHTGTQASSTISDFTTAVDARVTAGVAALVDGAPAALDTLNEIAEALNDDATVIDTMLTSISTKAGKFAANVGNGALLSVNVPHNLGTTDVVIEVFNIATGETVNVVRDRVDANNVTITFNTAPASASHRVVVLG